MPDLETRIGWLESDVAHLRLTLNLNNTGNILLRHHVTLVHDRVNSAADRIEDGIRETRRAPGEPSRHLTQLREDLSGITRLLEQILDRLPPGAALKP